MMIVDVYLNPPANHFRKGADPLRLPDIDQNQAGDGIQVKIPQPLEIFRVGAAAQEKLAHAALLGAGKDHGCAGIEPACRHHGADTIEIRVQVGGYDIHKEKPGSR